MGDDVGMECDLPTVRRRIDPVDGSVIWGVVDGAVYLAHRSSDPMEIVRAAVVDGRVVLVDGGGTILAEP